MVLLAHHGQAAVVRVRPTADLHIPRALPRPCLRGARGRRAGLAASSTCHPCLSMSLHVSTMAESGATVVAGPEPGKVRSLAILWQSTKDWRDAAQAPGPCLQLL